MKAAFETALAGIRAGEDYSLCGHTLTVGGVTLMNLTDEEFDLAYDAMDEMDAAGEDLLSLRAAGEGDT